MKNKNLWLSLLIFTGVACLLTWVIPSTNYSNSGELTGGAINPIGLWDVFYYISMLPAWFGPNFIFIIAFAVFYGVVNRTGALRVLVERIAKRFSKREELFLIISSSFFILVSSLTGINFALLAFVPLFAGVILTLGYNKITTLVATVASIIVGAMGSLYATTLYSAISTYVDKGITLGWYKLGLIVAGLVVVGLYLHFTTKNQKENDKDKIDEEMLFIEKGKGPKNQKVWPIITAFSLLFLLFVLGLTPWENMYGISFFSDIHTSLLGIKIGSFAIFKSFLGASLAAFGTWELSDATSTLLIMTVALILIYKVKWEEAYKSILASITKLLPTAILVLFANLAFVALSQSGALNTIVKVIAELTDGINVFTYSFISFIGAALVNETYITSYVTGILNTILGESADISLLLLIQQVMYGIAMLVAPTSVILLVGLSYFEVEYTKWIKNVWKFLLIVAAIGIAVVTLAAIL